MERQVSSLSTMSRSWSRSTNSKILSRKHTNSNLLLNVNKTDIHTHTYTDTVHTHKFAQTHLYSSLLAWFGLFESLNLADLVSKIDFDVFLKSSSMRQPKPCHHTTVIDNSFILIQFFTSKKIWLYTVTIWTWETGTQCLPNITTRSSQVKITQLNWPFPIYTKFFNMLSTK